MVLAPALAGGEAAWEAGAGVARGFRSSDVVLSHQSLQLLQRKESSESFNAVLETKHPVLCDPRTAGAPILRETERTRAVLFPHRF